MFLIILTQSTDCPKMSSMIGSNWILGHNSLSLLTLDGRRVYNRPWGWTPGWHKLASQ